MSAIDAAHARTPTIAAGLAVFVKTPGRSPLKTRLAAGIGDQAAQTFHLLAVCAVAETVRALQAHAPGLQAYWAVAETDALDAPLWRDFPVIAQGEGDLGARMRQVYETLRARHGRALLIGADAPQLAATDLSAALTALRTHACALGPSEDGGFWLFAGREALPETAWRETPWSQADTAARFLAHAGTPACVRLRALRDVDTAADLPALRTQLRALHRPLPGQERLLSWLETLGIAD